MQIISPDLNYNTWIQSNKFSNPWLDVHKRAENSLIPHRDRKYKNQSQQWANIERKSIAGNACPQTGEPGAQPIKV